MREKITRVTMPYSCISVKGSVLSALFHSPDVSFPMRTSQRWNLAVSTSLTLTMLAAKNVSATPPPRQPRMLPGSPRCPQMDARRAT